MKKPEHYEFTWFGKSQAKRDAFTPTKSQLVFDKKRSINPTHSRNLIIEGENLKVLKLLKVNYREKVKCIYIDPPYNTGKQFVYSDNFRQTKKAYWKALGVKEGSVSTDINANGRYHSVWLSMMYSRLIIARELLKADGIIFISIDDNEVHNLRKLCDEVFAEDNFIGQIVWKTANDNNPTQIVTEHEYVVCYAKDIRVQGVWEIPSEKGRILQAKYSELRNELGNNTFEIQNQLRKWMQTREHDLSGVSHYSYVDNQGVYYPGNPANTKPGRYNYNIRHPITKRLCSKPDNGYRWPQKTFNEANKKDNVQWGKDETTIPRMKKRLGTATQKFKSYYCEDNRTASKELKQLFDGKQVFNNPKSVHFLKHAFQFVTGKQDIVLDFFAGSGSTGQAIMELNKKDGGNRSFILVQSPELIPEKSESLKNRFKKISDITIERCKRVIRKVFGTEMKNNRSNNTGFKVFILKEK